MARTADIVRKTKETQVRLADLAAARGF